MEWNWIWSGTDPLLQVLVSTPLIYVAVIVMVRVSGKRTTAQMNNFDWLVTVAMGSLIASGMISKSNSVATVAFAIAVLLVLQWIVTRSVFASDRMERLVKAEPRLLVSDGRMLEDAMKAERVASSEILAAVREAGCTHLEDVAAVVLETDGSFSVFPRSSVQLPLAASAFANVDRTAQRDPDGPTSRPPGERTDAALADARSVETSSADASPAGGRGPERVSDSQA